MEKLFLVEIDSLDNENGCYASNAHFSKFFQLSKNRCTEIIKSLEEKKLVDIKLERKGKQITKRTIVVLGEKISLKTNQKDTSKNAFNPIRKTEHPYSENRDGINTNNNNTKEREKRAHEFLKSKIPSRFETLEMQNKKHVSKWEDLLEGFSDKVIIEKLEWDVEILFARLNSYVRSWRSNDAGKEDSNSIKPVYLRKIS